MNLVGQNNSILYGTGRLFVQGPTEDEYELAMQKEGGKLRLEERRKREEVDARSILDVDEWAFYENEDEVSPRSATLLLIVLDKLFPDRCPPNLAEWQRCPRTCAKELTRQMEGLHFGGFEKATKRESSSFLATRFRRVLTSIFCA